jgi:DNA-binding transcriptional MerR regulator
LPAWFVIRHFFLPLLFSYPKILTGIPLLDILKTVTVLLFNGGDMQDNTQQKSLEELARMIDIPVRTIRYYIAENLLPGPDGRGKAASYGEEHLLKLRLIRRLAERHVPLAEMQSLLPRLSLDEVRVLLEEEDRRARELEQSAQEASAKDYLGKLLQNAQEARKKMVRESPSYTSGSGGTSIEPGMRPAIMPMPKPAIPPAPFPGAPPSPASPLPLEVPPMPATVAGESQSWRRWELASGVELHIRADAETRQRSLIERLFRAAGKIFRSSY